MNTLKMIMRNDISQSNAKWERFMSAHTYLYALNIDAAWKYGSIVAIIQSLYMVKRVTPSGNDRAYDWRDLARLVIRKKP